MIIIFVARYLLNCSADQDTCANQFPCDVELMNRRSLSFLLAVEIGLCMLLHLYIILPEYIFPYMEYATS